MIDEKVFRYGLNKYFWFFLVIALNIGCETESDNEVESYVKNEEVAQLSLEFEDYLPQDTYQIDIIQKRRLIFDWEHPLGFSFVIWSDFNKIQKRVTVFEKAEDKTLNIKSYTYNDGSKLELMKNSLTIDRELDVDLDDFVSVLNEYNILEMKSMFEDVDFEDLGSDGVFYNIEIFDSDSYRFFSSVSPNIYSDLSLETDRLNDFFSFLEKIYGIAIYE